MCHCVGVIWGGGGGGGELERPVDHWVNPDLNQEDSGGCNLLWPLWHRGRLREAELSRRLNLDTTNTS